MGSGDETNGLPKEMILFNPSPNVCDLFLYQLAQARLHNVLHFLVYKYEVPQCVDGVKIRHLVESKYPCVEPHNQQVRGFVHRSTCDTTMFLWKQVPVVREGQWGEELCNNTKQIPVAPTTW